MWFLTWLCAALAAPVSPTTVVGAALEKDPLVVAAQARVEAAKGGRQQSAGPRYNPVVQLGVALDGTRIQGQVVQPLSVTGEGLFDRRAAGAELDSATAALARARLEAAARARRGYAQLALAEADLNIAQRQLAGASRLRGAAEARLDAGEAPELEAQLARLEEARAVASWLNAGTQATAARAELVAITGLPSELEVESDPMAAARGFAAAEGGTARSDVAAAAAAVDATTAGLAREHAAILPPVGLGAFYEVDQGRVVAGPMISVELPIWKQNQAGTARARGEVLAARAELEATQARATVEQEAIARRLDASIAAEGLLDGDLTADAAAALSALQQAYSVGQTDLNTTLLLQARVTEGERGWYAARTAMAESRIDVALAREDEVLLGTP